MSLKSILKKPPTSSPLQAGSNSNQTQVRNRQIALHHATLLQGRKDIEAINLASLEELIDFPTSKNADPCRPSGYDLTRFRSLVDPFQMSDYDALIEERNADNRCGYVFCPRPCKRRTGLHVRLGRDPNAHLPEWCSKECARRAMYVKIQMSDIPAWERAGRGHSGQRIELLREGDEELLLKKMKVLDLAEGNEDDLRVAMATLATERGEAATSGKPGLVMSPDLHERVMVQPAKPPDEVHDMEIEGHVPNEVLLKWNQNDIDGMNDDDDDEE